MEETHCLHIYGTQLWLTCSCIISKEEHLKLGFTIKSKYIELLENTYDSKA